MLESNVADQVQINVGDLMALKALCIAMLSTHLDPDELQRVFSDTTDLMLSRMMQYANFGQKSVDGLRELTHAINETLRGGALRRAESDHASSAEQAFQNQFQRRWCLLLESLNVTRTRPTFGTSSSHH